MYVVVIKVSSNYLMTRRDRYVRKFTPPTMYELISILINIKIPRLPLIKKVTTLNKYFLTKTKTNICSGILCGGTLEVDPNFFYEKKIIFDAYLRLG